VLCWFTLFTQMHRLRTKLSDLDDRLWDDDYDDDDDDVQEFDGMDSLYVLCNMLLDSGCIPGSS
jgi:hypothetical protein